MTDPAPPPAWTPEQEQALHDLIAARGLVSESEGEGRDRHTVITAAG